MNCFWGKIIGSINCPQDQDHPSIMLTDAFRYGCVGLPFNEHCACAYTLATFHPEGESGNNMPTPRVAACLVKKGAVKSLHCCIDVSSSEVPDTCKRSS